MNAETVILPDGKTAYTWSHKEKPSVNHWYRIIAKEPDYYKILKDFYSPETKITYYKIVEYYNGDQIHVGKTLAQIRELIRESTYRMVI